MKRYGLFTDSLRPLYFAANGNYKGQIDVVEFAECHHGSTEKWVREKGQEIGQEKGRVCFFSPDYANLTPNLFSWGLGEAVILPETPWALLLATAREMMFKTVEGKRALRFLKGTEAVRTVVNSSWPVESPPDRGKLEKSVRIRFGFCLLMLCIRAYPPIKELTDADRLKRLPLNQQKVWQSGVKKRKKETVWDY